MMRTNTTHLSKYIIIFSEYIWNNSLKKSRDKQTNLSKYYAVKKKSSKNIARDWKCLPSQIDTYIKLNPRLQTINNPRFKTVAFLHQKTQLRRVSNFAKIKKNWKISDYIC